MRDFVPQVLSMLAWAFTTAGQTDAQLFTKCAMEAVQHADDFNAKGQWKELAIFTPF